MKKQLILFALLFYCISCAPLKKEVITKSTVKLEGKNTNIRNFIDIDGYYSNWVNPYDNCRMFFEDGTCVSFSLKRDIFENEIKNNLTESVISWIQENQFRWGGLWGVYKIVNDTLVVHSYTKGSSFESWRLSEDRYKIIDKNTIERVSFRGLLDIDAYYGYKYLKEKYDYVSADSLPTSDCWLKEEKWIWRNESDWKAYMEKIEVEKEKPAK